ncbi:MAG: acetyl-CoA carboxylase biotin carboxyl carrier protein subunit [Bacteroidales bacterium]|jgi:biotin carboxyl carrier protein
MNENDKLGLLNIDASLYKTRISKKFQNRKSYQPVDPRIILSFIPGTVLDILIEPGQNVSKGDNLMILDAMKMQNRLKCHMDGKVKSVAIKKGDKVSKGTVLIELE